jgi:hypothetical protein
MTPLFMASPATVEDPIDALSSSRGVRRTKLIGTVLGYLMAHAGPRLPYAQLQVAAQQDKASRATRRVRGLRQYRRIIGAVRG